MSAEEGDDGEVCEDTGGKREDTKGRRRKKQGKEGREGRVGKRESGEEMKQ